jgi:hypothetical protein
MGWLGTTLNRKLAISWTAALILCATAAINARAADGKHTVTVKFDYNFSLTPACTSAKADRRCVQEFVLYDISAGEAKRTRLMTIPVPPNPKGSVKGISATTPPLLFEPGKHFLAVVARMPSGAESTASTCWVTVP